MSQTNRREFTRVEADVRAEVRAGARRIVSRGTRGVSMKGLFLLCDSPLEPGTECELSVHTGDSDGESVKAKARVARVTDEGMALQFLQLVGLDSYRNLRSLVLLNASNREQVEGEINRDKSPGATHD